MKANEGWLSDYRHPDRMPGYYDAEEAGYGGSIIAQKSFFINIKDNEEKLKQKTQKLEYRLFPEAIIKIFKKN